MALGIKGSDQTMKLQPGWEIIDAEDDTLRATLTYIGPWAQRLTTPRKYSTFPMGDPLVCYEVRYKRLPLEKAEVKCDFIGIRSDPTPFKIDFPGGSSEEAIETHERFEQFAGTPAAPNQDNGAVFDPVTSAFINFTEGSKRGVRSFISPNVIVNVSYWSWRVPRSRRVARDIVTSLQGVVKPASVKNFLLIGLPYRQVGSLYAVTEQWRGSGPNGWDRDIYS
jgi:hypothetical protein